MRLLEPWGRREEQSSHLQQKGLLLCDLQIDAQLIVLRAQPLDLCLQSRRKHSNQSPCVILKLVGESLKLCLEPCDLVLERGNFCEEPLNLPRRVL